MADWYQIKKYDLGEARTNCKITDFPEDGDSILVLENENATLDETYIKFDSPNAHAFDIYKCRKLRHKFKTLYITNSVSTGNKLRILIGKGEWDVERHYPEEQIYTVNADTVDSLHASASVEVRKLLALGSDGFFPDNAVRNIQSGLFANLPATPVVGDIFIATDTGVMYVCFTAGVWTNILTPTADQIAFTPAGDIVATDVQAAIEELDAEKIADIADVIKDGHIDWGTGANQVSAADMPIADPGGIITAVQVEGALQEIMTDLDAVEVDLNGFPDELKNLVAAEIQQLENIGPTTMSADQWGFLGAIDAYSTYINQQFNNLLRNGSFESWSPGVAGPPDGWAVAGVGATIAREATIIRFGEYSAKFTRGGNDCYLYSDAVATIDADTNTYWRGRTVTFGCWVYATVADRAQIKIDDAIGSTASLFHSGAAGWEFLTVTRTLDVGATRIRLVGQILTGNTTAYFDGAVLIEGTIAPTFAQHHNDEHLKAIDYQDATPTNFDYGLLRMECGIAQLVFVNGTYLGKTITFGTAFSKILAIIPQTNIETMVGFLSTDLDFTTFDQVAVGGFRILVRDNGAGFIAGDTLDYVHWVAIGI